MLYVLFSVFAMCMAFFMVTRTVNGTTVTMAILAATFMAAGAHVVFVNNDGVGLFFALPTIAVLLCAAYEVDEIIKERKDKERLGL